MSEAKEIEEFFNVVLPDSGYRCVAHFAGRGPRQKFYAGNGPASVTAAQSDATGSGDVYFACASYRDVQLGRKGANVAAVRSFWADLDTCEFKADSAAQYLSRKDALSDLERFCFRLAIPSPSIVSSGYGLHVYWTVTNDLSPDDWRATAVVLKRACDLCGLQVDPSRATDIASLLRVPGTYNRKDADNPKPVALLRRVDRIDHAAFHSQLETYVQSSASHAAGLGRNIDVATEGHWFDRLDPADKDACLAEMLRFPAVVALADTRDRDPSPNWLTILAACARSGAPNAKTLCRRWAETSDRFKTDFNDRYDSFSND